MEDNILYYLVIGAIYVISRFLKKKKPQDIVIDEPEIVQPSQPAPTRKKNTNTVKDLLEELSREMEGSPKKVEAEVIPAQPVYQEPDVTTYHETKKSSPYVTDKSSNKPVAFKDIQRDKPEFEKSEKYEDIQENNPTLDKIHEMLSDEDSVKSAIIMQEIFQRKY